MFEHTQHFAIMLFFLEIDSTEGCGSADATTGAIVRQKKRVLLVYIFGVDPSNPVRRLSVYLGIVPTVFFLLKMFF